MHNNSANFTQSSSCKIFGLILLFILTFLPSGSSSSLQASVTCGDVNNDGIVNFADLIYLTNYVYSGGPAPIPYLCVGDVNSDGEVDDIDVTIMSEGGAISDDCCDSDGDGVDDAEDNCPDIPNELQLNSDGDIYGDSCDNCPSVDNPSQTNSDGDSHGDACDNCELITNENQQNSDGDSHGDVCDNCPTVTNEDQANSDADTHGDACDNCPTISNEYQVNSDNDSHGDYCDNCDDVTNEDQINSDNDIYGDDCDNCPWDDNTDQANSDNDSYGDACDNCPDDDNEQQSNSDTDNHGDDCDNCPWTNNDDQANSDNDTYGDVCDNCPDDDNQDQLNSDNDSHGDECDNCKLEDNEDQADALDSDGVGDVCDNCPEVENPDQKNSDMDEWGDECDNCLYATNPEQEDIDDNGLGDACDCVPHSRPMRIRIVKIDGPLDEVEIILKDGTEVDLETLPDNYEFPEGTTITTGDATVIVAIDGCIDGEAIKNSMMSIRPVSEVTLDRFLFAEDSAITRIWIKSGEVRVKVTEERADYSTDMKTATPNATAGVSGTDFIVRVKYGEAPAFAVVEDTIVLLTPDSPCDTMALVVQEYCAAVSETAVTQVHQGDLVYPTAVMNVGTALINDTIYDMLPIANSDYDTLIIDSIGFPGGGANFWFDGTTPVILPPGDSVTPAGLFYLRMGYSPASVGQDNFIAEVYCTGASVPFITIDGYGNGSISDCNGNLVADEHEIGMLRVTDCNDNGIPDDCEAEAFLYCDPQKVGSPFARFEAPGIELEEPVGIINDGMQNLSYSITVVEDNGPSGWLAYADASGSVLSNSNEFITVRLNAGGVATTYGENLLGRLIFNSNAPASPDTLEVSFWVQDEEPGCAGAYICGDANSDTSVNVSDAVYIINYVFSGGTAPNPIESCDGNCDGSCNVSDAVYIINYVFSGGTNPCDTNGDTIPDCQIVNVKTTNLIADL